MGNSDLAEYNENEATCLRTIGGEKSDGIQGNCKQSIRHICFDERAAFINAADFIEDDGTISELKTEKRLNHFDNWFGRSDSTGNQNDQPGKEVTPQGHMVFKDAFEKMAENFPGVTKVDLMTLLGLHT